MKVALVHDYLKEYGGAERVLSVLHEMFPEAPIYAAFKTPGSSAETELRNQSRSRNIPLKIITSWADWLIRYKNLHSVLRFLIPLIWESFVRQLADYDVVILSSSGYLTKPVRIPKYVRVICYCHTPPRFLYGYPGMDYRNYWYARLYKTVIAHFLRLYDWYGAQRVDQFVANSYETAGRIEKFYRKGSVVVYPPVGVASAKRSLLFKKTSLQEEFFLIVGRIVGFKGVDLAIEAAKKLGVRLKIVGEYAGVYTEQEKIRKLVNNKIEILGRVSDEELQKLYSEATAFLALAKDEDFGITPVEAMAAGTPVVAYKSGGYLETVVEGKTGVFFEEYSVESLVEAMKRVQKMRFKKEDLQKQAEKFSKENFVKKMREIIANGKN